MKSCSFCKYSYLGTHTFFPLNSEGKRCYLDKQVRFCAAIDKRYKLVVNNSPGTPMLCDGTYKAKNCKHYIEDDRHYETKIYDDVKEVTGDFWDKLKWI